MREFDIYIVHDMGEAWVRVSAMTPSEAIELACDLEGVDHRDIHQVRLARQRGRRRR